MSHLLQLSFLFALLAMLAAILLRLFDGQAMGRGLLATKVDRSSGTEADRLQLLLFSLGGVGYLVFTSLPMAFAATPPTSLPEAPNWLLTMVGGGQLVYLGGKGARLHLSKRGTS
jgi:hypothetical protein